jgi:hypothetical protein
VSPSFRPVPGVRLEAIGDDWVVFSPLSGNTAWLNDTAAAVLEVLAEAQGQPLTPEAVAAQLALDSGESIEHLTLALADVWPRLQELALILPDPGAAAPTPTPTS